MHPAIPYLILQLCTTGVTSYIALRVMDEGFGADITRVRDTFGYIVFGIFILIIAGFWNTRSDVWATVTEVGLAPWWSLIGHAWPFLVCLGLYLFAIWKEPLDPKPERPPMLIPDK